MDFKQKIIKDDHEILVKQPYEFLDWNSVKVSIDEHFKNNQGNVICKISNISHKDEKYNILANNDGIIFNETEYLKDRFFFKGIFLNPDMNNLIDIYIKNMNIEEIVDENEDDEYACEEEEILI